MPTSARVPADLSDACGESPNYLCERVFDATDNETVARLVDWVIDRPLRVLLILAAAWLLNRILRRAIDRFVAQLVRDRETQRTRADKEAGGILARLDNRARRSLDRLDAAAERSKQRALTLGAVLRSIATGTIWLIAALLVLGELNVSLGPLLAGAGIVGIALGFGAQSLVSDFLAGIFIIIEDQYGVGDIIDVGDAVGEVEGVTLRTTRIRDIEGALWVVPNGEIHRVANKSQIWSRTILDIDVAYDTDLEFAFSTIKDVADKLWSEKLEQATIIEEPEVWGVQQFGDNAITIRLAVKTEPAEQWSTARLLRGRLKAAFDEAGIEIPFPQRDVWMRTSTGT